VAFGLALGAVIALIAERVSRRSIRLVEAEKITGKLKDPGAGPDSGAGSAR
jgi:hypothetical protein